MKKIQKSQNVRADLNVIHVRQTDHWIRIMGPEISSYLQLQREGEDISCIF